MKKQITPESDLMRWENFVELLELDELNKEKAQ
jgi:hypothetical protein